jgi:hypothetical protein
MINHEKHQPYAESFSTPLLHNDTVIAFPHGWQRPARTEQWTYERCLTDFSPNRFAQAICFPWATLIDLLRKGKVEVAQKYKDVLRNVPPRTTLIRATVCQHIYAKDMLAWFKLLKISDLFWSHATQAERVIDGIRVHPFPLYPVCSPEAGLPLSRLSERKYLYSFIGAYQEGLYISAAREHIFALPQQSAAFIKRRTEWHFEKIVYREQIEGAQLNTAEKNEQQVREQEYRDVLSETIFSLCPSGSGPNSIRLWESLEYGCIPVILSDTLRLPGDQALWEDAAVFVPESAEAIAALPRRLESLARDTARMERMQSAGNELRRRFGKNGLVGNYMHEVCSKRLDEIRLAASKAKSRNAL